MFERYTDEAKRAIYFARIEAAHRDERSIGTEDILLGLTWDGGSRACRIAGLKDLAVELRAFLKVPHLPSTALEYKRKIEIPLDNPAKIALAYAAMEADDDREYWLDTDYLLRGLLRFDNDASGVLKKLGMRLEAVRAGSVMQRQQVPSPSEPAWTPELRASLTSGSLDLRTKLFVWIVVLALFALSALFFAFVKF